MMEGHVSEKKEWNKITMSPRHPEHQHSGPRLTRKPQPRGWYPQGPSSPYCVQTVMTLDIDLVVLV